MPTLKIWSVPKNLLWKSSRPIHMVVWELVRRLDSLVNRSFCWLDIWRIGLKSNWRVGLWSRSSQRMEAKFIELTVNGFTMSDFKNYSFEKSFSDGALSLYTGYSGNSSHCLKVLRTDHFVDGIFRSSNWSPTEQLIRNC